MNKRGKIIKKFADILAVVLIVMIAGGILSATGLLNGVLPADKTDSLPEILTPDVQSVYELDIEVATASIEVIKSDSLRIETEEDSFRVKNKSGKITIEERNSVFGVSKNRFVKIYLPEDFTFQKVQLETGASNIEGELIRTEYLEMDVGAGRVCLERLEATKKSEIDCGAGEFTLKSGSLNNLEFSLGVGIADITAELKANAEIESGVGELKLCLPDGKDSYCFDIETGLGGIIFDGSTVKGDTVIGNGATKVSLEGGVGSMKISFAE